MREFCKFSPEFWSGALAEKLKKIGRDALLLATYLQTNRHSNMIGVYYLPIAYMSYDTGIPLEHLESLLDDLGELNFCHYDKNHSFVWVVELGFIQTGGALKGLDKRVIQLQKQFEALPMVSFLPYFYEKYGELYHLKGLPDGVFAKKSPIEGPSKALRSKKKKKEKNKEKEKKKENTDLEIFFAEENSPVEKIFNHWRQTMDHPQAVLDKKRERVIVAALDLGYDEAQLCEAITGCSYTPHNMGDNETGQRYDGLQIIFRDADQIDRFRRNYETPPKRSSPHEKLNERNSVAIKAWLEEEATIDGNT